ncbi:MAG: histidine kinase dimerization/phosphoacceptor domain-containing protein [Clostridiales bacterium]|nr:histidine kinase dimerization/phosphoacceptor domain-containing protein [Clostridiales bacterium]
MSSIYGTFYNNGKLLIFALLMFSMFLTVYVTVIILTNLRQNKLIFPYMIYQLIAFVVQFFTLMKLLAMPEQFIFLTRISAIMTVYLESLFLILIFSLVLEKTPSLPFMLSMIAIPFVLMNIIIIEPTSLLTSTIDYQLNYGLIYYAKGIYQYIVALISLIVVYVFIYRMKGKLEAKDIWLSLLILLPICFDIYSRFFHNGLYEEISYFLLFSKQLILLYTISRKWAFKMIGNIQKNTLNIIRGGVIIINSYGTIVYSNGNGLLGKIPSIESENQLKVELHKQLLEPSLFLERLTFSLIDKNLQFDFQTKDYLYYLCSINQLLGERNTVVGVIVSFTDITEYKLLIEELTEKNLNLDKANTELENQEIIIRNISMMKKKEKISQDIRDLLANTMTQILTSLEASEILITLDKEKAKASLQDVMNLATDYLDRVRKMVSSLKE